MQNILAAIFDVESEGYQAITTLRKAPVTEHSAILQMALVKCEDKKVTVLDSFDSGLNTQDDTLRGGVLGSFLGILGGPIGVLLMGSTGALLGSALDTADAVNSSSLLETVIGKLQDGCVALVAVTEETEEADLDAALGKFKTEILRYDAAVIAEEVEEAQKMEKEMARQARLQLRQSKKAEREAKVEEMRAKLTQDFEAFKAKFKK